MPQMGGGNGSGFDYIQSETPENPQNGESWFDLDGGSDSTGEVKVYDGASGAWEVTGYTSHGDLTDVTPDAHHSPVSVSEPLTEDGTQGLALSIGDGLEVSGGTLLAALNAGVLTTDSSGAVTIAADAVTEEMLAFATATQSELDSLASATSSDLSALASDLTDHATRTDNPHEVSDDQTGAASALSSHANDGDAHHTRYSDSEASNAAPVQSVNGNTGAVTVEQPSGTQAGGKSTLTSQIATDFETTDSETKIPVHGVIDRVTVDNWDEGQSYVYRKAVTATGDLIASEDGVPSTMSFSPTWVSFIVVKNQVAGTTTYPDVTIRHLLADDHTHSI